MPDLSVSVIRRFFCLVSLLAITACSTPIIVSPIGPDGTLNILGPAPDFAKIFESGYWVKSGDIGPGTLVITEKSAQRSILIPPGSQSFAILRPIDAILLSTPYLGWSWLMEPHQGEYHSVSVLVGFRAPPEAIQEPSFSGLPEAVEETPANRALEIRWAASALKRGNLTQRPGVDPVPVYVVRGGRENLGRWWREGVDLSHLYGRLWPGEDPARARIVFIAILAGENRDNSPAYLSDIRLFR